MCGLAGFWCSRPVGSLADTLQSMTSAIAHRGPDGAGHWIDESNGVGLGHRRLAVVELSSAGAQPMVSHCGRYQIIYNGEIYNHLALRKELSSAGYNYAWTGQSDTETLLAAISAWGFEAAIKKIDGMYAIALWDSTAKHLYLARDRLGEKPLYYGCVNGSLVFASELRAFKQFPGWQPEIDPLSVARFLRYSSVPAPASIYKGIYKLPPAHWVCIERPETLAEPVCYWSVNQIAQQAPVAYASDTAMLDALDQQLQQTVESRMMSDVPFGAFLSGGIDSSLVVALMQLSSSTPVNTFSIGFEETSHNEAPFAAAVANELGTNHHEHYVTSKEALDVVPSLSTIWDEPFADPSQIPTFLVSQHAREKVTVCLTGDGGDELFGGYTRYAKTIKLWQRLRTVPGFARSIGGRIGEQLDASFLDKMLSMPRPLNKLGQQFDRYSALSELIGSDDSDVLYDHLMAHRTGMGTLLLDLDNRTVPHQVDIPDSIDFPQRMLQRDLLNYLPDVILAKVDRASMAVSLETRAPLLDPALAEFAIGLPWSVKQKNGVGKWPLVSVLHRYLPAHLVDRPKMGFGVPIADWLRGPLKPWAEEMLSEPEIRRYGLLDSAKVDLLWQQHQAGRFDWHHTLWNVLMLQNWLCEHG